MYLETLNLNPPIFYPEENIITSSVDPSTLHCSNTQLANFYRRYLLQEVIANFKVNSLPEYWDKDFLMYTLFINGFAGVINPPEYGVIPQSGTTSGQDIWRKPTDFISDSPFLKDKTYTIHKDCELIQLQPNMRGVMDIIHYYANLMAIASEGIQVDLYNSKFSLIFGAENENIAKSLKKTYDKVASGDPAVVVDKSLFNEETGKLNVTVLNQGLNLQSENLLNALDSIKRLFCLDVGIPSAPTKSENLIAAEVKLSNGETYDKVHLWLDTLNESSERVNKMFGTSINWEFTNKPILDTEEDMQTADKLDDKSTKSTKSTSTKSTKSKEED